MREIFSSQDVVGGVGGGGVSFTIKYLFNVLTAASVMVDSSISTQVGDMGYGG